MKTNKEVWRELKFRAWNGEKMIVDNFDIEDLMSGILMFDPGLIWMQYIGLRDINGKEVCDKDIVIFEDETIDVVGWDNEWQYHSINNLDNSQSNFSEAGLEIIGNIFENPDKLTSNN